MDGYLTRSAVLQAMTERHVPYAVLAKRMDWPLDYLVLRLGGRIPLTLGELGELAAALGVDVEQFVDVGAHHCATCGAIGKVPVHWTICPEYRAAHDLPPVVDKPEGAGLELVS